MFHGTRKVGFVYMALLVTLAVTTVQAQNHPVKNVVLVHGAWADGSGWNSKDLANDAAHQSNAH